MLTLAHGKVGTAPGTSTIYLPNPTMADLRGYAKNGRQNGRGLGLIMPPSWPTGRTTTPPGLPGTIVVKLSRDGSAAGLMGAGLGAASFAGGMWPVLLGSALLGSVLGTFYAYKKYGRKAKR